MDLQKFYPNHGEEKRKITALYFIVVFFFLNSTYSCFFISLQSFTAQIVATSLHEIFKIYLLVANHFKYVYGKYVGNKFSENDSKSI